MKSSILTLLLFLHWTASAHPGIGMVRNSKGAIFYTDLERVWRLEGGRKTVAVPNVHTHELYIDANDNLYGEHLWFIGGNNDFMHYYWVMRPNGSLDTIVAPKPAYRDIDFPLARDRKGRGFFIKEFVTAPNTSHIFMSDKVGKETIVASGSFKGIKWLHPQADGSLLFVMGSAVRKVSRSGRGSRIIPFGEAGSTLGGAWQDRNGNIFVALFEQRIIKKLSSGTAPATIYRSPKGWSPVFGLFDEQNDLWVLEYSSANEVRVIQANGNETAEDRTAWAVPGPALITALVLLVAGLVYKLVIRRNAAL